MSGPGINNSKLKMKSKNFEEKDENAKKLHRSWQQCSLIWQWGNYLNSIYSVTIFRHNSWFLHSDNVRESICETIITEIKIISMTYVRMTYV